VERSNNAAQSELNLRFEVLVLCSSAWIACFAIILCYERPVLDALALVSFLAGGALLGNASYYALSRKGFDFFSFLFATVGAANCGARHLSLGASIRLASLYVCLIVVFGCADGLVARAIARRSNSR
jgi:hypothetical protein